MNKTYLFLALIILGIALSPYLFLAFFTVPSADDFLQAKGSLDHGMFGYVQWRYLTWNGRYTADFLVAFYNILAHRVSSFFILKNYYIAPLLFIFFYMLANFIFLSVIAGARKFRVGLVYSLIAVIAALNNTEVRSTFFWFSGGIPYVLSNALFIVLTSFIIRFFYVKPQKLLFVSSLFLIPFINGLSETIMVACTVFILGLCVVDTVFRDVKTKFVLEKITLSAFAIISALIVYAAPGNIARSHELSNGEANYLNILLQTTAFSFLKAFHWLNLFWIVLIFIIILLVQSSFDKEKMQALFGNKKNISIILFSLLLSFYASYLVRFYTLRSSLPLRADSTSYTVFLVATTLIALYLGYNFDWFKFFNPRLINKLFLAFITLFCCFSFASSYSFYSLAHDFKLLKSHYEYYQTNYPVLLQAAPGSEVELSPEPRVQVLRWKCYLTDNKDYWVNQAVADYFGLESVIVRGGGGTDPDAPGNGECGG